LQGHARRRPEAALCGAAKTDRAGPKARAGASGANGSGL